MAYHRHDIVVKFHSHNGMWEILQPGKDSSIYIYSNGTVWEEESNRTRDATDEHIEISLGFE